MARESWKQLGDRFGSLYDRSHRPYGITARLELGETAGLFDEIVSGRWDLSAEQFDYYLSRLGRQAPADNPYEFARELEAEFRHTGPLATGEIYRLDLSHDRIWYVPQGDRIIGLAADTKWVANTLAPQVRAALGMSQGPQRAGLAAPRIFLTRT